MALTLSSTIKQGQTVTVDYKVPETNPIQDVAGNEAGEFTNFAVTNDSTADGTPPVPASALVPVSGDRLTLNFNEDLDIGPGKLPPASAFTVKADGVEVTVQSVLASSLDRLALTLSSTIKQGQTVTVSYKVPETNPIQDTDGNRAVAFTDFAVTNESTVDGTPPVPASALVPVSGDRLTLNFNEDLDIGPGKLPPAERLHRQGRRRRGDGAVRVGLQFLTGWP